MNYITIKNLEVYAHHGVFPEETAKGQNFYLTVQLYFDTSAAADNDDLTKSVDYGDVCHFLTDCMQKKTFLLIETAAEYVAQKLLVQYPLLEKVEVTLNKPNAPVGLPFENIGIHVERAWHDVYLSIGSNMGNRRKYMDDAIAMLRTVDSYRVITISSYINTAPYGYVEQPDFLNGAVYLRTFDTPHELLDRLQGLEKAAGRKREIHWGPRTLDLDILFYDDLVMADDKLVLPHPDMEHRSFVLEPLKEIAPNLCHPLLRKRIKDMEV